MSIVNNVTRLLDSQKIEYTALEWPAEKLSALEIAEYLSVPAELVYKTIVITRDKPKKPLLVVVPAASTVDLKKVAACLGEKKVYLPTEKEAEKITGLQAGGISPLALINKSFQVILDASANNIAAMYISGGQRGLTIRISPEDFVRLTRSRIEIVSSILK